MAKLLTISVAILALAFVVAAEKKRIPFQDIIGRRDPFPEPKSAPPSIANISLLTVTQRVDNFNPTNSATWEQRYYVNNEFYLPGSPIFLFLGGEWNITEYRLTNSHMYTMAREFNANILYLEHRFYGESRPTDDVSDANLRFLNPEQALADTAHFINFIQSTVPGANNSEFILVGGHYSASLAIWFRQSYPHLSLGVWASSAPITSIINFEEYKVAVGAAYRRVGGDSYYDALEFGFQNMEALYNNGQAEELTEIFSICDLLEPADIPLFFTIIAEVFALLPMFSDENSMQASCTIIESAGSSVESMAHLLDAFLPEDTCLWIDYEYLVEADRQTAWSSTTALTGIRQWSYKMCTQIGWFHSSTSPDQPFGSTFPIEFYYDACEDIFDEIFSVDLLERNSARFNTNFGGLEPEVTNVIFVHGEHDPWSVAGRRTDLNNDTVTIVIPGATMGNDLGLISEQDSDELVATKLRITEIIRGWLSEADATRK